MKRIASLALAVTFFGTIATTLVSAQDSPLGDLARRVRKQKTQQAPTGKKFDNDNLPTEDKLSVVGEPTVDPKEAAGNAAAANNDGAPQVSNQATKPNAAASDQGPTAGEQAPAAKTAVDQKPADDDQAQKKQLYDSWKKKIQDQQGQIDLLARELDVQNREYRLRAAAFYADAGNRLRNSGSWDKEDSQYKDQIAAKQKALDEAKQHLDDMQEEARKAGVPSSVRE